MIILCHRGIWESEIEQNTVEALMLAVENKFGIETDIRDHNSSVVISHDLPSDKSPLLEVLLEKIAKSGAQPAIALNIKADGLQKEVQQQLSSFDIKHAFVFDMSVPDMRRYMMQTDVEVFTRHSEIEKDPVLYSNSAGVWMDELTQPWITKDSIGNHLTAGKKVCVVSPELHRRQYKGTWSTIAELLQEIPSPKILLCTDKPMEARETFHGQ